MLPFTLLVFHLFFGAACSASYDLDISWVVAAPDGVSRPVIGINGQWPPPVIEGKVGEEIIVMVHNNLGNETTSIHWHGIHQVHGKRGIMDGPTAISQCPIPPGSNFTYSFIVDLPGTYWYHSHDSAQYPDGLRGPLIIRDPDAPYKDEIEDELILKLSDWYHTQAPTLLKEYQSAANTMATEPVPDSILINDGQSTNYIVKPGKTYLFRIINMGSFPALLFNIEDHNTTIVAMDGVYTERTTAQTLNIGTGQRFDVLVTTKTDTSKNFDISALIDMSAFNPITLSVYKGTEAAHASLDYSLEAAASQPRSVADLVPLLPPIDDITIAPLDRQALLGPVNQHIELLFNRSLSNGIPRATINNVTYISQKVPTLYTALTVGKEYNMNPLVYGQNSNPYVIKSGEVVEITIINNTPVPHPWHLHGHNFQVINRSTPPDLTTILPNTTIPVPTPVYPTAPMRRDTVNISPHGNLTLRFKADNPGVWLIHCHVEWHVSAGMQATIIEAPDALAEMGLVIPDDHLDACRVMGIPSFGNAAGNSGLDMGGSIDQIQPVNEGAVWPVMGE